MQRDIYADNSEWESVKDTFTIENINKLIPDYGFAEAVYDEISKAIKNDNFLIDKDTICNPAGYTDLWPEPLSVADIIDSGDTGEELVIALLKKYC